MKKTSLEYIVKGTFGKLYAAAPGSEKAEIDRVFIDSRKVDGDCLFFCIIGERVDAHEFLYDVREKGCRFVVVSDEKYAEEMKKCGDMNVVLVEDTRRALINLAIAYMDDWEDLIRVGVTGSVGKTGTKEFIASVLATEYRTGKTKGNLNSELGIPLTVFDLETDIEVAVIEMGIGYDSYMEDLAQIVKPDIAVITTIGSSHEEVFGSRAGLIREKLAITSLMNEDVLIFNSDCDALAEESVREIIKEDVKIRTIGTKGLEDYRLSNIRDLGIEGVECDIESAVGNSGEILKMRLPVVGAHNLSNAALAIATGEVLGIDPAKAIDALSGVEMNANRLELLKGNGVTVINDTYNASPESMKAGIDVLTRSSGGRKVAILGSMYELGDSFADLHSSVGRYAAESGVQLLVAIGDNGMYIADGAEAVKEEKASDSASSDREESIEVVRFPERSEAVERIASLIKKGDIVLVKASRSMELEEISKLIVE